MKKKDNPPPNRDGMHDSISLIESELTRNWSIREIQQALSFSSYTHYESMLGNPYEKLSLERINKCGLLLNITQAEVIEMIELEHLLKKKEVTPEGFRRFLDLKSARLNNERDIATYAIQAGLTKEDLEKWK